MNNMKDTANRSAQRMQAGSLNELSRDDAMIALYFGLSGVPYFDCKETRKFLVGLELDDELSTQTIFAFGHLSRARQT